MAVSKKLFVLFQEIVGKIDADNIKASSLPASAVVNEIFNSTLQEIVHEVNIPIETLSDPILLGVSRNTTSAGRPSSEYYVRSVWNIDTQCLKKTRKL